MQKDHLVEQAQRQNGSIPMSVFSNWMGLRLLRMKSSPPNERNSEQSGKHDDSTVVVNGKSNDSGPGSLD